MSLVSDREQLRRPVTWLILAGMIAALICLTHNAIVVFHDHGRPSGWITAVGFALPFSSQLAAAASRRTLRK